MLCYAKSASLQSAVSVQRSTTPCANNTPKEYLWKNAIFCPEVLVGTDMGYPWFAGSCLSCLACDPLHPTTLIWVKLVKPKISRKSFCLQQCTSKRDN